MKTQGSANVSEHEERLKKALVTIENLFRPYFPGESIDPQISRELEDEIRALLLHYTASQTRETARLDVTILLSDIRGFTSLFEELSPDEVIGLLNQYFSTMCVIISRHHGRVDKFMGDSIMAVFSTPGDDMNNALQAVICAAEMQVAMDDLNQNFKESGLPEVFMGIGINTGQVMAGMIGSDLHREYTIIGDEVNLASRIEAYSLRGQVLISQGTFDHTRKNIEAGDGVEVYVKGKRAPVTLYEVLGVTHPVCITLPRRELRKSPRVNVYMPFEFQCISNQVVKVARHKGCILDISFNGLRVEVPIELPTLSEVKLTLDFVSTSEGNIDVYAKVLSSWRSDQGTHQTSLEFTSIGVEMSRGIQKFIQYSLQNDTF